MLDIVYEDPDILAVNKPAGISVHPDEHRASGTLLQEARELYPEAELAHRLDMDTSGVLLIAKHPAAGEYLKGLFKGRAVQKTYLALAVGEIAKDEGTISLPIGRSTKDFKKRVASPFAKDGFREAVTEFRVKERFPGFTLLEVHPKTGRTHQIRSHLSAIGHPVACDSLYGGKKFACPGGLSRQFLHAYSLEFTLSNGKRLAVKADLPADLSGVLMVLGTSLAK